MENNKSKLRCVAISDIHGYLEKPKNMPQGDVLCICGDIVPLDYQNDLAQSIAWFCLEFVPWTDSLSYRKVIFIAGNHDFFLQELQSRKFPMGVDGTPVYKSTWRSPLEVLKKLLPGNNKSKHKLIYLCDNSVEIEGKKFYGTPWIADMSGWAFYLPESELVKKWEKIPDCDVILTHMPPKVGNVGKVLQSGRYCSDQDFGSESLAETLKTKKFQYILSGHIHSGAHDPVSLGIGKAVNVSIKSEDYNVFYYPLEVDI